MLKKYFTYLLLSVGFLIQTNAQNQLDITINGVPKNASNDKLVIERYYVKKFELISTTPLGNDSVFHINYTSTYPTGLFQIYIINKLDKVTNKAEFIFSKNENLDLNVEFFELKNGDIHFEKSIENEAYAALLGIQQQFEPALELLFKNRVELSFLDSTYKR